MNDKKLIYQATWSGANVNGKIKINGVELSAISAANDMGTVPLNVWLIGKNEVQVELAKINPAEQAECSVAVSALTPGEPTSTNEKGNLISLLITNKDLSKTFKVSKYFNSALDFSSHLISSGPKPGEKELLDYAGEIYRLFAAKDNRSLLKEFAPKLKDYASGLYQNDLEKQFESYLKDELFKSQLEKVNTASLKAVKAGPTLALWHIMDGNKEFIRTVSAAGDLSELPIYIGMFEGKLKVIR